MDLCSAEKIFEKQNDRRYFTKCVLLQYYSCYLFNGAVGTQNSRVTGLQMVNWKECRGEEFFSFCIEIRLEGLKKAAININNVSRCIGPDSDGNLPNTS
jgi:hypothetical protein